MKRNTEKIALTVSKFASLVGCDRHELKRKLEENNAHPEGSQSGADTYGLRDLVNAFAGGDERAARIRQLSANAERIEIQNARSHGELVSVEKVKKLGEAVMIAIRQKILSFPIRADEQNKLLLELLNLKNMDWNRACD